MSHPGFLEQKLGMTHILYYFFFSLGKKTWRPRYIPQLGQAWCESRGFLQFGQATSCGSLGDGARAARPDERLKLVVLVVLP